MKIIDSKSNFEENLNVNAIVVADQLGLIHAIALAVLSLAVDVDTCCVIDSKDFDPRNSYHGITVLRDINRGLISYEYNSAEEWPFSPKIAGSTWLVYGTKAVENVMNTHCDVGSMPIEEYIDKRNSSIDEIGKLIHEIERFTLYGSDYVNEYVAHIISMNRKYSDPKFMEMMTAFIREALIGIIVADLELKEGV